MHTCLYVLFELHIGDGLEVFVSGFMCCMADEFDPEVALSRTESSVRNKERQRDRRQTRTLNHPDLTFGGGGGLKKESGVFLFVFLKEEKAKFSIFTQISEK